MTPHIDATTARAWYNQALLLLADARVPLDALNVFPVPDSDTGSNLLRTMRAGARVALGCSPDANVGELAAAVADGSLWGARGNSGIILAQSLQAIAATFKDREVVTATDLIRAFDALAAAASHAVARPVEGTMITVARRVASATLNLPSTATIDDVVLTALESAYEATERTADQLPALAGTGRVDAGAVGFTIILEGLALALDLPLPDKPDWFAGGEMPMGEENITGFEVMYVVKASMLEARDLREHLSDIGEAVVVVRGGGDLWHVHAHVENPADALPSSEMSQVVVRRLDATPALFRTGVVATTSAPGLIEPLALTGAVVLLNPRARTIGRAIIDAGCDDVIVLPCNEASEQAAHRAADLDSVIAEEITVHVADTASNIGVIEAIGTWQADADADTAVAQISEIIDQMCEVTITRLGHERWLVQAAESLAATGGDVVTILTGRDPGARSAGARFAALVSALNSDAEVITLEGGQAESVIEAGSL